MRARLLALWFFCVFAAVLPARGAETIPPAPKRYFNDYANVVPADVANRLNGELENFEKQTSTQIVVVVYPRMETDSSIEDYTHRLAQSWGVGQKGKNNGAVLFVFVNDRKMRIEVGYGLEGALPDALAKRIIDDEIAPHFKRRDYAGGLQAGVTAMMQAVRGEYKGTGGTVNERRKDKEDALANAVAIGIVIIFLIVASRARVRTGTQYGRKGRSGYTGWWWGGGGWGGGGGSSSGGGGGGFGGFSGGGGSFGGGGASGSW